MEHRPAQFTHYACQTAFVAIVGTSLPARRVTISYSRREALDDLISYLNMWMAETILPDDATELEIKDAYADHLGQPVEIVVCD
ncbi:MAG: hypothetical protein KAF27_03225 [Porphyrobacter sp.]|nr:hypothetical protein [Porphyrobacter sp.]